MISQILPWLSKYINAGIAIKGISKINPKLADFVTSAGIAGYGADSILDFLRNKTKTPGELSDTNQLQKGLSQGTLRPDEMERLQHINQQQGSHGIPSAIGLGAGALSSMFGGQEEQGQEQNQAQQSQNVISQYDDQLHEYLEGLISKGSSPLEAGAAAQRHPRFKQIIAKLESDFKTPFSSILESIYGAVKKSPNQQMALENGQQGTPQQGKGGSRLASAMETYVKFKQSQGGK